MALPTNTKTIYYILRCGGDQASVTWDALRLKSSSIAPIVWDDGPGEIHPALQDFPRVRRSLKECLQTIEVQMKKGQPQEGQSQDILLAMYICHGNPAVRRQLHQQARMAFSVDAPDFPKLSFQLEFPNLIHHTAFVSPTSRLGAMGIFIGPQAVVHCRATVGNFCLVNSSSTIEHDVFLDDYVNVNPGAVLCGGVMIASGTTVGAQACIRDHVSVAADSFVGMSAAVVQDLSLPGNTYIGVPAKVRNRDKTNSEESPTSSKMIVASPVQPPTETKQCPELLPSSSTEPKLRDLRWVPRKPLDIVNFAKYLQPSIAKGHLTNDGPLQRVLTGKIHGLCQADSRYVLMAASGTAALHALAAGWELKLKKRLRWATQSFTFPSSIQGPFADAIIFDMDEHLYGPSMEQLQEHVEAIDGVVVTNVFGLQANIVQYEAWCRQNNKLLLLDNAATPIGFVSNISNKGDQAEGLRSIHQVGDGSIVSLHETKPLGRGEGGAIFCAANLQHCVHRALNFGFNVHKVDGRVAYRYASNWRMSDIAAAAICDHLDYVEQEKWKERGTDLARYAQTVLKAKGYTLYQSLILPTILSCLLIRLPQDKKFDIDSICSYLKRSVPSIEAKRYYRPLGTREDTPLAWKVFDESICLPFHVQLSRDMIDYEVDQLEKALSLFEEE